MFIADLHIHSKYSRATSKESVPELLELWARRKGIDLIGTGDFTHPGWREELYEKLEPAEEGFYTLKKEFRQEEPVAQGQRTRFLVTGEISSIYKKNGKVRKIHNLILLPSLEDAQSLSKRLEEIGNLHSDGRPILGLDSRDLLEITLECCPKAIFIPAHIWTPHFSLFGAFSGFDSIEECFEDLTGHIHALETGLSSDPPMNWRLSALDRYTLVSNSDAHSPSKLGREANLFRCGLSYPELARALEAPASGFGGTIEFFPEEGKYHYDGHRSCHLCLKPSQAEKAGGICPVCGKKLTIGVLHRVEQLADRAEGYIPPKAPHFESLIPLPEVLTASTGISAASTKAKASYQALLENLGSEFTILRKASIRDIELAAGACVAEGIRRMRAGKVKLSPGFDGEYGKIQLLDEKEMEILSGQLCFFAENPLEKKPEPRTKEEPKQLFFVDMEPAAFAKPFDSAEKENVLSGLNEEQQEAVTAIDPVLAVVAGPGTGKTKTLIARIVHLIQDRGVKPSEITAVTFTNKAAAEMRQRLEACLSSKRAARAIQIGTFHAVCLQLLKKLRENITLLDEFEARSLARSVARDYQLTLAPQRLLQEISARKNGVQTEGGALSEEAFQRYEEMCREFGVLDYDDLLLQTLPLFQGKEKIPGERAFHYLLVDELQDCNELQYQLIRAWSKKSKGLFLIGDPDQSIYGFRGATADCFSRIQQDDPRTRVIRLTRNYRSTPQILAGALPVLRADANRILRAQRSSGEAIRLVQAADSFSEAVYIAKEINRLVGGIEMLNAETQREIRGFSDIAVLYRTHRQAEVLGKCLQVEGIPYLVAGRDSILSENDVRGVLGFFRFLCNPQDLLSLRTCLLHAFSCPAKLADEFVFFCKSNGTQALLEASLPPEFEGRKPLEELADLAARYAPLIQKEKPGRLLESWNQERNPEPSPALERLARMMVFHRDLPSFLQNLTLGRESDVLRSSAKQYVPDAVLLSTLHGAKGLEFPVVFLCGANQGTLPLEAPGRETDQEEERRLLYVGMTRARDELILSASGALSPLLEPVKQLFQEERGWESRTKEGPSQLSLF